MINSHKTRNRYLFARFENEIDTISLDQWCLELFIQNAYLN